MQRVSVRSSFRRLGKRTKVGGWSNPLFSIKIHGSRIACDRFVISRTLWWFHVPRTIRVEVVCLGLMHLDVRNASISSYSMWKWRFALFICICFILSIFIPFHPISCYLLMLWMRFRVEKEMCTLLRDFGGVPFERHEGTCPKTPHF